MKDSFALQLSLALGIFAISFVFLFSSVFDSTYVSGDIYDNSISTVSEISKGLIDGIDNLTVNIFSVTDFFKKEIEVDKQAIQNSFSDEIQVSIDADGKTGIINPVFKDSGSENYLYVLMPSKDLEK